MKKFTKICLWTALITVCTGIVLAVVGASLGGLRQSGEALRSLRAHIGIPFVGYNDWDWYRDYDDDYYDDDYYDDDYYDDHYDDDYYDDDYDGDDVRRPDSRTGSPVYYGTGEDICRVDEVRDLRVRARKSAVDLKLYDGETFRFESERPDYFKVYRKGWELNVYSNERTGNSNKYKITLYIPRTAVFNEVKVDIGAGICTVDGIKTTELDVDLGAGEASLHNVTVNDADMDAGAGTLSMSGTVGRKLKVDCGVGSAAVVLNQKRDDFNYELECAVGTIRIDSDTFSGLGRERKINNNALREISVDCGVGEVSVDFEEI